MICFTTGNSSFAEINSFNYNNKLIELRLDLLNFTAEELAEICKSHKRVILSLRPTENLMQQINLVANLETYNKLYVDIDRQISESQIEPIQHILNDRNCRTIHSFHKYDKVITEYEFGSWLESTNPNVKDYYKISCLCNSGMDLSHLTKIFVQFHRYYKLIVSPLGEKQKFARFMFYHLGSRIVYLYNEPNCKTAEGQLSKIEFDDIMKKYQRHKYFT